MGKDAVTLQRQSSWKLRLLGGLPSSHLRGLHDAVGKHAGLMNHVDRFDLTVRRRVLRSLQLNLPFSKKPENCIRLINSSPHSFNYTEDLIITSNGKYLRTFAKKFNLKKSSFIIELPRIEIINNTTTRC